MLHYITFNTFFEIQCFIIAVICLTKDKNQEWRGLIVYLLITCLTELTGIYFKTHHQANQWPYNILLLCHILFTSYMFYSLLNKYINSKPIIHSGLAVLSLFYLYDTIQHGFFRFNMLTYNAMSVFFAFYSLFYFYLLLQHDTYIRLSISDEFWWTCGTLFFYFGSTAVNLFRGKPSPTKISSGHSTAYYIYIVLNMLMYGFWSYSFICRKWLSHRVSN